MVQQQSPLIISRPITNMDTGLANNSNNNVQIADISLAFLGLKTRRQLSNLLNREKILRSEEGYERDWRGIARLANLLGDFHFDSSRDPMVQVLDQWCQTHPQTATIGNLRNCLGMIDRWDVSDDIYENLVRDAQLFHEQQKSKQQPIPLNNNIKPTTRTESAGTTIDELDCEQNVLTRDDTLQAQQGLPLQTYDAFLLFADQDRLIAIEVIEKIEDQYNFKLYTKNRDLLAGLPFEHVAQSTLIDRCRRVIVILTEDFLKSAENTYLINLTQMKQIQNNRRKIIPVLYDPTLDIPDTLKVYTSLKYQQDPTPLYDFWGRLADSLRDVTMYQSVREQKKESSSSTATSSTSNANTPNSPPPSICVNGQCISNKDDEDIAEIKKKSKLRNAVSTSQLLVSHNGEICGSEPDIRKKRKNKLNKIKKLFSIGRSKEAK